MLIKILNGCLPDFRLRSERFSKIVIEIFSCWIVSVLRR